MRALITLSSLLILAAPLSAAFNPQRHDPIPEDWIKIDKPGSYAEPGKTYILTKDVAGPTSTLFLGNNVTLDLNGYTLTYADADYRHLPNYGFEDGLKSWDTSDCPGAAVLDTDKVKPFIGKKILKLPQGEQLTSKYIDLPVANRAYYAMCGVLSNKMRVRIDVEDADGNPVKCEFRFGNRVRPTCPQEGVTKLGGGFVFALIYGQPAGRYRIRVKALNQDALIDEVDIRPALDVGIAVVEKTYPWAYFRCVHDGDFCALFDYTKPGTTGTPVDSVPKVTGQGTVTIRNGTIRSAFAGIRSWGVMSTANDVKLVLDNVKIVASGINTNAVSAPFAEISNCRFEIDTPFIINRHQFSDSPVALRSKRPSTVHHSEFVGGQGCLNVNGDNSVVHDNLFVNRQTVTNHYSIMLGGRARGIKIFRNRFEPEIGSGITMFGVKDCEVYENSFNIIAANGNCEYTNDDYSTNAIRITDYNAPEGSDRGAFGNRIHHNTFHITGKHYTNYPRCKPVATAMFVSVGGGKNVVHDNTITVDHKNPGTPAVACAFYIGGSNIGGDYSNNTITTNVPAFWIGTFYGNASNVLIRANTIIKADNAPADFKPFRLGYGRIRATGIRFINNSFKNCTFGVQSSRADNQYTRN